MQAALIVADAIPALAITGVVVSQGAIDAADAAWEVGPLAPGAAATIDITATVTRVARLRVELRRVRSAPADGHAENDRAQLTIDVVPPGGGGRYIALGNTDAGPAGEKRQRKLVERARSLGVRLLGPNSMGVVDLPGRVALTVNAVLEMESPPAGHVSLISQSGTMLGTLLSRGAARGLGFAKMVSVGNECDLGVGELV